MQGLLGFPHPVNEKAARVVAGCVMVLSGIALTTSSYWLLPVLFAGFLSRVLSGPRFSPLGLLATKVVAPRLGPPKYVSGPPKRFAQGIGAVMTGSAAVLALGFGNHAAADVLLGAMVLAAGLESIVGFCVGCQLFGLLMRTGVVPQEICAECADIWAPRATRSA